MIEPEQTKHQPEQPVVRNTNIIKNVKKVKTSANLYLSYIEFFRENPDLNKYKLVELKSVAKTNRLFITGSKPVLINRITTHFNLMRNATKIQSIMKGYFVRRSFQLRGPAFKDRKICVNETDFYTLEPLPDIPFQEFFSYTDSKNFVYGFNILSLITLYRKKRYGNDILLNPYNRDIIDIEIKTRIFSLYNYIKSVFPDNTLEEDKQANVFIPISRPIARRVIRRPIIPILSLPVRSTTPQNTIVTTTMRSTSPVIPEPSLVIDDGLNAIRANLVEIRSKPIETRIQELFMEIDQLGHYTDSTWFSTLGKRNFYLLYFTLEEIWSFRAHIPSSTKSNICPLGNPFLNFPIRPRYDTFTEEEMCSFCLHVMENFILTSVDIEYRKLGAFHVLTALTVHSLPARNAMLWLYESIY